MFFISFFAARRSENAGTSLKAAADWGFLPVTGPSLQILSICPLVPVDHEFAGEYGGRTRWIGRCVANSRPRGLRGSRCPWADLS